MRPATGSIGSCSPRQRAGARASSRKRFFRLAWIERALTVPEGCFSL
jgi:hypothetical protein